MKGVNLTDGGADAALSAEGCYPAVVLTQHSSHTLSWQLPIVFVVLAWLVWIKNSISMLTSWSDFASSVQMQMGLTQLYVRLINCIYLQPSAAAFGGQVAHSGTFPWTIAHACVLCSSIIMCAHWNKGLFLSCAHFYKKNAWLCFLEQGTDEDRCEGRRWAFRLNVSRIFHYLSACAR